MHKSKAPANTQLLWPNRLVWYTNDQDLLVGSGYMAFPLPMGDSQGVATIDLKNYSTSKIGWVTDRCWFDLFEGNRVCLRIAFRRTERIVTFNQVVNNNWTDEILYHFPDDLVAGKEVALSIYYVKGVFTVAFNDLGTQLAWGAPADSLEYRADHAGDAIFRDWVSAKYSWYGRPRYVIGGPPPE